MERRRTDASHEQLIAPIVLARVSRGRGGLGGATCVGFERYFKIDWLRDESLGPVIRASTNFREVF